PQDLVKFPSVKGNWSIRALPVSCAKRDQYCGCLPILRAPAAIIHDSTSQNLTAKVARSPGNCKAWLSMDADREFAQQFSQFANRMFKMVMVRLIFATFYPR